MGLILTSGYIKIWNALLPAPEVKELYDLRYAKLMADKGITPN